MSSVSALLLCGGLACLVSGSLAAGGFDCSVEHICNFETRKCKHVTICEEFDDMDNMERVAMAMRLSQRGVVRMPGDFVKFDTNVDKVISPLEFVSSVSGNKPLARRMFVEADTNGDHGVTCSEFSEAPFWTSEQKQRQNCEESGRIERPRTILVK